MRLRITTLRTVVEAATGVAYAGCVAVFVWDISPAVHGSLTGAWQGGWLAVVLAANAVRVAAGWVIGRRRRWWERMRWAVGVARDICAQNPDLRLWAVADTSTGIEIVVRPS